ncbi:MAG: hypothetical protein HZA04_00840 [Nitrospinae bacterium]|nr:hypothetical protein [Nitrospinota bacterium]
MSFQSATNKIPELASSYQAGLGAVKKTDREKISAKNPRAITGSIDLDASLSKTFPNDNRWDYGIGYKKNGDETIHWIEVHPASAGEVKVIIAKSKWLLDWLRNSGQPLKGFHSKIIWISSGTTSISPVAPQRKILAQNGIELAGGHYSLC